MSFASMKFYGDEFFEAEHVALLTDGAAAFYLWLAWIRFRRGPIVPGSGLRALAPERFRARWPRLWSEVLPLLEPLGNGTYTIAHEDGFDFEEIERADARRDCYPYAGYDEAEALDRLDASRRAYVRRQTRLAAARKLARHTPDEWFELLDRAAGVCPRCELDADELQKDHVVPLFLGGSDGIENLQPLCRRCNVTKRRETTDWLAARGLR